MVIRYVAYNPEGQRLSGKLEANSPSDAENILIRSNLTVVSLKKEFHLPKLSFNFRKQIPSLFGTKPQEIAAFNRELSSLLDSGISLLPAIRLLQKRVQSSLFRQALVQVAKDIEMGKSFSEACSTHTAVFPSLYIRLATIGEATGNLSTMLRQISIHLEKQAYIRSKLKKALTYPAFVLLIGFFAAGIMITVTLPALTDLVNESGGELPLNARILLSSSDFLALYGIYILLGIMSVAFLCWMYIRTYEGKKRKERLQRVLPGVRSVTVNGDMSAFSRTLSTLMAAGVPLAEAVELTINATDSTIVREALTKVREDLLTGEQLSEAISRQRVFPYEISQMISVGEQAGTIQENLESLANLYERATEESTNNLTGVIQPAVVIVAGVLVGFIMITLMQSVYGSIGQIE